MGKACLIFILCCFLLGCGNTEEKGTVMQPNSDIQSVDSYKSFVQKVESGMPVQLKKTDYTTEGDPITHEVTYTGKSLEYILDDSKDKFGPSNRGRKTFVCKELEKRSSTVGLEYMLTGCTGERSEIWLPMEQANDPSVVVPKDFHFKVKFGVEAKNEINTFSDSLTKDLIKDGVITIHNFTFKNDELIEIYNEIKKADIFLKKELNSNTYCRQIPFNSYELSVQFNGRFQTYTWSEENCGLTKDAQDLTRIVQLIRRIVEKKEQFKKLPESRGGYD
ncbi:DUF4362 domain-containing protein [Brevibacillus ginsengisoli]|uniref:DUF4362 domain-containing protein n=1 Tax=Brevibacillus ginsengisoli TaxID=363854 RepID=UPI003CF611D6